MTDRSPAGDAAIPATRIEWPEGRRSAGCLTFDLDAEAVALTADPGSRHRLGAMSHQAYGPLIGVPRILDLLDEYGVTGTFFTPGFTAERYPSIVREIAERGHEVAAHGYLHENMIGMPRDVEAQVIERGIDAVHRAAGVRPMGYRAPMWEANYHTAAVLADLGIAYDSSLMDAEHPYRLLSDPADRQSPVITELPCSWLLDDWEQYAYLPGLFGPGVIESPVKALEMWRMELEGIHRLGGIFNHTSHPFLTGRPSRLRALEQLLESMVRLDGMWITSLGEIAEHVAGLDLEPRGLPQPELPTTATGGAWPPETSSPKEESR